MKCEPARGEEERGGGPRVATLLIVLLLLQLAGEERGEEVTGDYCATLE